MRRGARLGATSLALALMALGLGACATHQSAALEAARFLVRGAAPVGEQRLNPALRYLRVTSNGRPALLVLGYVDRDSHGRPVEVWYSADGEVLRLMNGRLAGLAGVPVEWHRVALSPQVPAWRDVRTTASYQRHRDEMPGYRTGLVEQLVLRRISAPRQHALAGVNAGELQWFEESPAEGDWPSPARYAVRPSSQQEQPVYGEQCLSARFCLSWQAWPP